MPSHPHALRTLGTMSWQRPNIGSRVTREGHARFWERPEVKFLRATRRGALSEPGTKHTICTLGHRVAGVSGRHHYLSENQRFRAAFRDGAVAPPSAMMAPKGRNCDAR